MKISLITPSYNQGKFIEKTIKSVLSQEYSHLEYLVIDSCSIDKTKEILKKYKKQIKIISEKDKGQGEAINKGMKLAKGEILSFLNADDLLEPGSLEKVNHFFSSNPRVMWVFGKCRIIDEKGGEIRKLITLYKNFFLRRYSFRSLLVLNYLSQPAVFWRREAFKKIGQFDEKEFYELDYDYWLRLAKRYQPGFIDDYLASFRVHPKSKTSQDTKHFLEEVRIAKKYTQNPFLIFLHYLNYLSILLGYSLIKK